jgi:hypothetical protein
MAGHPEDGDSRPDEWMEACSVPATWDRRYGRWARRVVTMPAADPARACRRPTQNLGGAALVAIAAAAGSWALFLVLAILSGQSSSAGLVGSDLGLCGSAVWLSHAVRTGTGV